MGIILNRALGGFVLIIKSVFPGSHLTMVLKTKNDYEEPGETLCRPRRFPLLAGLGTKFLAEMGSYVRKYSRIISLEEAPALILININYTSPV